MVVGFRQKVEYLASDWRQHLWHFAEAEEHRLLPERTQIRRMWMLLLQLPLSHSLFPQLVAPLSRSSHQPSYQYVPLESRSLLLLVALAEFVKLEHRQKTGSGA